MQTRMRREVDGDLTETYNSVTEFRTRFNRDQIICADCAKSFYTDKETYERFCATLERGLDNPFLCADCQEENFAAAFAGIC